MSVFKIAYVGNSDDKSLCDIASQTLTCGPEDSFEFVDITNISSQEMLSQGSFQGVLFYNDIYSSKDYALKLQSLLSMQNEKKDISIFSLARNQMSSIEALAEKETITQMFFNKFNLTMDDVEIYTGSGQSQHDLESYFKGIVQVSSTEYFDEAHEVELTVEQKVEKLTQMIDEATKGKHPYTAGHVQRVSEYTEAIAKKMGFNEKEMQEVVLAAKLHDIGKLLTPQSVLGKNSMLNFKERDNMSLHTDSGEGFLASIVEQHPEYSSIITPEVLKGVAYHHKDWDGKHGRRADDEPDPIRGNIIGKYALTIAVGDCIDAMTSQRAYNNPRHVLDMFRDLYSNRGKQFKPEIVEAAILVFAEEFAALGIDPLKIVPDEPQNPRNKDIDDGLKEFLGAHANEFEVNKDAKPGEYSKLGFRLDDMGYFELLGEYATPRDPQIRFNDEFSFLAGKYARENRMDTRQVEEDPEIVARLYEQINKKFDAQDREGAEAIARGRETRDEKQSIASQIFDMSQEDTEINTDLFKEVTGDIRNIAVKEQAKEEKDDIAK